MNLCIDLGNTLIKVAAYEKQQLKFFESAASFSISDFKAIQQKLNFQNTIISSVQSKKYDWQKWLSKNSDLHVLNAKSKVPFKNNYKSKNTLGTDRAAAVAGAVTLFGQKKCLIINAGTCMTIDFLNSKNVYEGGSISPGLNMRLKSMHKQTAALPKVKAEFPKSFIGQTTEASLKSGGCYGMVHEITAWIDVYENAFKNVQVILSGGDSSQLALHIKRPIFVAPHLVMIGLNKILELNNE